jgi:ABC-type glutathione transport system ATPase component
MDHETTCVARRITTAPGRDGATQAETLRLAVPLLQLRDVAKAYRAGKVTVPALRGVSLDVGEGEFLALVGPSGSGKSTLLHICGLIDAPDSGRYTRAPISSTEDSRGLDPRVPGSPPSCAANGSPLGRWRDQP